jgi:probable rRNA maturation factor
MNWKMNFFNEKVIYIIRKKRKIRKWLLNAIEKEGKAAGDLNFILCNDEFLSELNFKYLKHKTLTDILTFSLNNDTGKVCGDIFISLPRVKENAIVFKNSIENELHRVMIHGVLHLVGYHDKTKKEKTEMRAKENFYLELLQTELAGC